MRVSLKLATEHELANLLLALRELDLDFSLILAKLNDHDAMDVSLSLADPNDLVDFLLIIDSVNFSLVRAERVDSDKQESAPGVAAIRFDGNRLPLYPPPGYEPPTPTTDRQWMPNQQRWVSDPEPNTGTLLPEPYVTVCDNDSFTYVLDPDATVSLGAGPSSSAVVIAEDHDGVAIHDNFTGRPVTNFTTPG